nr:DNA alkylation repair protein [Kineosporia rhizophila]
MVAEVEALGDADDAVGKAVFFKTGPGEYGEGDEFVGVRVPELRRMARGAGKSATLADVEALLAHRWNEVRLLGGLILVELYRRAKEPTQQEAAVQTMLDNLDRLSNWNLVDSVAPYVLGPWLLRNPERRPLLDELLTSPSVWWRRTAVVATFALIRAGEFDDLLRLAGRAIGDEHDLMHKATGWMLREVGQRDRAVLNRFLDAHAHEMPRTMLRYALEKHPQPERQAYLTAARRV